MLTVNNYRIKFDNNFINSACARMDYNPLNLPPYTLRFKTRMKLESSVRSGTYTEVSHDAFRYTYDFHYENDNWSNMFYINFLNDNYLLITDIVGAHTHSITSFYRAFHNCTALTSVNLFDTINAKDSSDMFGECSSLYSLPDFDLSNTENMRNFCNKCTNLRTIPNLKTEKVDNVSNAFSECSNVSAGILNFYNNLTAQTNPPSSHDLTFYYCGTNSKTGSAELAQIPDDWKSV